LSPFQFSRVQAGDAAPREGRLDIASIDGVEVPGGVLEVDLGPKKIGGRYARVLIRANDDRWRFLEALYNDGPYPGENWIEVFELELPPALRQPQATTAPGWEDLLTPYFRPLGDAIPVGGHIMVDYESPPWAETERGLLAGIPPLATPLGALLYQSGCGGSFKDWYFPEGGQEGGRKLQGNKPFTEAQAHEMAAKRRQELEAFLAAPPRGSGEVDARARARAGPILDSLRF
jgi:hypothetical protein